MTSAYDRCSACGASVPPEAGWCPLCFTARRAPAPEPLPALPAAVTSSPPSTPQEHEPQEHETSDDELAALRAAAAMESLSQLGSRLADPRARTGAVVAGGLGLTVLLVLTMTLLGSVLG